MKAKKRTPPKNPLQLVMLNCSGCGRQMTEGEVFKNPNKCADCMTDKLEKEFQAKEDARRAAVIQEGEKKVEAMLESWLRADDRIKLDEQPIAINGTGYTITVYQGKKAERGLFEYRVTIISSGEELDPNGQIFYEVTEEYKSQIHAKQISDEKKRIEKKYGRRQ